MTNSTKKTTTTRKPRKPRATTKKQFTVKAEPETLPSNPFVYEVLELAAKQRSKAKKVEVLRTYDHCSENFNLFCLRPLFSSKFKNFINKRI